MTPTQVECFLFVLYGAHGDEPLIMNKKPPQLDGKPAAKRPK
jgi:hypothetical protein